jgi:hypothetical protein
MVPGLLCKKIFFFNCYDLLYHFYNKNKEIYSYICSSIISSNYIFKGLAFESLGPWCKETIDFTNVIGKPTYRGIRRFKIKEIPF